MPKPHDGTRLVAICAAIAVAAMFTTAPASGHGNVAMGSSLRDAPVSNRVLATTKNVATAKKKVATAKKKVAIAKKTVTVKKVSGPSPTTTRKPKVTATKSTQLPPATKPGRSAPVVQAVAPGSSGGLVEGVDAGNPGANAVGTVIVPVGLGVNVSTTTPPAVPTAPPAPAPSTTVPTPFPAAANLPSRATAGSITPYYGLGTWIDAFDWTVQKGGRVPKVSSQTIDAMAAVGVQTVFIQAARFDSADVAEPERLIPIINRAHELGMYVVVWYLPTLTDVNADLRRTVALANLDVDGISIDIEARNVANVVDRNRRLVGYSQALRTLLPGRFISNNIVQPNILEAVPNLWPTEFGKPAATPTSYWTPFPYADIAPYYDLWMIQSYWTQRSTGGGWRDAYKISVDNATRLRSILGRPDLPVYLIGGVGDRPLTTNDLSGWLLAHSETKSVGASFYDWLVTPASWWPGLWSTRYTAPGQASDLRFQPVPPLPYVAPAQPVLQPPTTTTSAPVATTTVTTTPGAVPAVSPVPGPAPTVIIVSP